MTVEAISKQVYAILLKLHSNLNHLVRWVKAGRPLDVKRKAGEIKIGKTRQKSVCW